jgi:uncharacterized protein (DUF2267 family)
MNMSTTGLSVIDSSLQRTHAWLDEIMADLGPDRTFAWHLLGSVLHAIRDRLPIELSSHFSAQLPLVIRGLYFDQWSPGASVKPGRTLDAFLHDVGHGVENLRPTNPAVASQAVFRVISRHLSDGELRKVRDSLPKPVRESWLAAEQLIASAG